MSDSKGSHKKKPGKTKGEITRRELLNKVSPLGRVTLNKADCTGCGTCAQECTTGALTVSANNGAGSFRLLFRHGLCVACGQCAKICPEQCLSVERILETEKIDSESVLFEDEIVKCARCGSPVGPAGMIARLRNRVGSSDPSLASRFELCPRCKVQSEFSDLIGKDGHIS